MAPIRHDFHRHPLLQIDELRELARRLLPLDRCRFALPGLRIDSPFDHWPTPQDGRTLDQVLERLEEPGSWLALYSAEVDPLYRELLREVEQHIRRLVGPWERVHDVRSYLFLSAPPSATPFHIDRENNFWLQIRGRKTITLWDHRDDTVVPHEDVERFLLHGSLQNVCLRKGMLERGRRFPCGPGEGVYFPSTTPHMTETDPADNGGDRLSISVGMVFYSNVTRRHMRVHMLNQMMRGLGFHLRPPGDSAVRDALKSVIGRALWCLPPLRKLGALTTSE